MPKENAGKGLSADHIPSFASLKRTEEAKLGRPLTTQENRALMKNSLTLTIETQLHQTTSETYGGRNNAGRQQADAANPVQAIRSNVNRYRQDLLNKGYSNEAIDKAINDLSKPFTQTSSSTQSSSTNNNPWINDTY